MKNAVRLAIGIAVLLVCSWAHATTEWSTQDYDLYAGDFDGDQRADILYIAKDPAQSSGIAFSDSTGPHAGGQTWPGNYLGIPWSSGQYSVIVADFNGDGRADIFLQSKTPGDSYLLFADSNGMIAGISQTVPYSMLGLYWSADQHRAIAGDFNGDGKTDLFLQSTAAGGTNAVILADANGQFTSGPLQSWSNSYLGFKWSTSNANVFAGDFNGDGRWDLLVQAKPNIVMIDYDIPIPVPTYPPNMNGMAYSGGGASPFQQSGVQQWSRNANGVDWSPNAATPIIEDFNGDGRTDVLLQAKSSAASSYLLNGNSAGAALSSGAAISSSIALSVGDARLIVGKFGGSAAGIYVQALTSSGTNYLAVSVNTSITASSHNLSSPPATPASVVVGRTPGSFAVTNSGAAAYSIPIIVPPGIKGIQPKLGLQYSSGSGNGLMGMGWSISGLSAISRCAKTIAQDGYAEAVKLAASDSFCLDGNKLRVTSGLSTYGQAGSTYQTEIEQFSKITASGSTSGTGPQSFTLQSKDGLTYEYGNTTDSRIEVAGTSTPRTWALNKVSDKAGNAMVFNYYEDNGSYRPKEIIYTSNTVAGLAAAYKVTFVWESRPADDVLIGYVTGGLMKELNRLSRIETQYNAAIVKQYRLSYESAPSTKRSRLTSIQECDGSNSCLSPTVIGWQNGTNSWSDSEVASPSVTPYSTPYMLDLDGDGHIDLLYIKAHWCYMKGNAAGSFDPEVDSGIEPPSPNPTTPPYDSGVPVSYFGDGMMQLMLLPSTFTGILPWKMLYWNGSGLTLTDTNITAVGNDLISTRWFGDFDGDGRVDYMHTTFTTGAQNYAVAYNTGKNSSGVATFGTEQSVASEPGTSAPPGYFYGFVGVTLGDFNGDGRTDFIRWLSYTDQCNELTGCSETCRMDSCPWLGKLFLSSSNGTYTASTTLSGGHYLQLQSNRFIGDFNGDGKMDFLSSDDLSQGYFRYGTGTGLSDPVLLSVAGGESLTPLLVASKDTSMDFNGDGRQDITTYLPPPYSTVNAYVLRSNGTGFESPVETNIHARPDLAYASTTPAMIADVDGDGLSDIVYVNGPAYVRKHNGVVADFVNSVVDGFGNSVSVTYAPLTDSTVYTKGSGAQFPRVDVKSGQYVVKKYDMTDGIGSSYSVTEKYSGGRIDMHGRGFIGFAHREESDGRTGITTNRDFNQELGFPFDGTVAREWTTQSDGKIISDTVYSYLQLDSQLVPTATVQYNERHYPYASNIVQTLYEVGETANGMKITEVTTAITPDAYGTPLTTTVTAKDVQSSSPRNGESYVTTTTNSNVLNDTGSNWCLGRPQQTTVTHLLPDGTSQTRTTGRTFDAAKCRLTQEVVEPSNATNQKLITDYVFNDAVACGNPATIRITGYGLLAPGYTGYGAMTARETNLQYGSHCQLPEKVFNALNQETDKDYDYRFGLQSSESDPNHRMITYSFDSFGRKTHEQRVDTTTSDWVFSACNTGNGYCGSSDSWLRTQMKEIKRGSDGAIIQQGIVRSDTLDRPRITATQRAFGIWVNVNTAYNNLGQKVEESIPFSSLYHGKHRYTYDLQNRLIKDELVTASNSVDRYRRWTFAGRILTSIDPLTNEGLHSGTKQKQFDVIGQVRKIIDPAPGGTTTYGYTYNSSEDLVSSITDAAGNTTSTTTNRLGFRTAIQDPDMGSWSYTVNSLGELLKQTDAKSQTVAFTYDPLSRPLTRVEPEAITNYSYGISDAAHNIGQLESVSDTLGYAEAYLYDSAGRLKKTTYIEDTSYDIEYEYNTQGSVDTLTYPTSTSGYRLKLKYGYSSGQLSQVKDANGGTVFWTLDETDDANRPTDEKLGNGVRQRTAFDALTGTITSRESGNGGLTNNLQRLAYQWDKNGNLQQRQDQLIRADMPQVATEVLTYDAMDRLDESKLNGSSNLDVTLNAIGNLTYKSDVGNYTYSSAKPHAVVMAGSNNYDYDANGNMTLRNGYATAWTSYNLPSRIDKDANDYSQFYYGVNRNRWKQIAYYAGALESTIYVGGIMEKMTVASGTAYRHYINAGGNTVVYTRWSNGVTQTFYSAQDSLGSTDAITDQTGALYLRESFAAYGGRRASNWNGTPSSVDLTAIANSTRHGYTGHEHLDNVGLIHMNGRVFDPQIGRFMSADPLVQAPEQSQSYNRYSYTWNNPFKATDPTGFECVGSRIGADAFSICGGSGDPNMGTYWDSFRDYQNYMSMVQNGIAAEIALTDGGFTLLNNKSLGIAGVQDSSAERIAGTEAPEVTDSGGGRLYARSSNESGSIVRDPEVGRMASMEANQLLRANGVLDRSYRTERAAAKKWGDVVQPITNKYQTELGSKLFQMNDGFHLGPAYSEGIICTGKSYCYVNVNDAPNIDGGRLVGITHTHPDSIGLSNGGEHVATYIAERKIISYHGRADDITVGILKRWDMFVHLPNGQTWGWEYSTYQNEALQHPNESFDPTKLEFQVR